jgi:hypothetical protein
MMPGHDVNPINDKSPFFLSIRQLSLNEFEGIISCKRYSNKIAHLF